jgi:molybdenum cofactor cytidylyltransferase
MKSVAVVILAAGESSRMGTSKQLLEIEGKPLLERTIELTGALGEEMTIVVLGANAAAHQQVVKRHPRVSSVVNEDWEKGLGSSIKAGLAEALRLAPRIDAALFVVCDQPLLGKSHLEKIISAFNSSASSVIASGYDQTEGVPALFGKMHFPELLALKDREGAKRLIEKEDKEKMVIAFPEGRIDLDTPEDLRNYLNNHP